MEALSQLRNYIFFPKLAPTDPWHDFEWKLSVSSDFVKCFRSSHVEVAQKQVCRQLLKLLCSWGARFQWAERLLHENPLWYLPDASHSTSGLFDKPWRICFFMFHGLLQQEHRGSNSVAILTPVPLWGTGGACSVEQHFFNFQLLRQTWTKWEG